MMGQPCGSQVQGRTARQRAAGSERVSHRGVTRRDERVRQGRGQHVDGRGPRLGRRGRPAGLDEGFPSLCLSVHGCMGNPY
jgi:hypothetical protein